MIFLVLLLLLPFFVFMINEAIGRFLFLIYLIIFMFFVIAGLNLALELNQVDPPYIRNSPFYHGKQIQQRYNN